jgi:7-carboxy-7-deazaguanine synthase
MQPSTRQHLTHERSAPVAGAGRVRITEIFHSLQGEGRTTGWPTVFIRLTGCPLRCTYCDTAYAFTGGTWASLTDVLERVAAYATRHVMLTGGEPLAQKGALALLRLLCDGGYDVSLETSGALDISGVDPRVARVVDLKTPASGESARNRYENLGYLTDRDQVKFVVCDRHDYEWARAMIGKHRLSERCEVLFSPAYGVLDAVVLAEWVLEDRLPVRFQIQLHKHLWGDRPGV